MSDQRPRAERLEINQKTDITSGDDTYAATLQDLSDTGAAVSFNFAQETTKPTFDLGGTVTVETPEGPHDGRVVRHYENGFAVKFDSDESTS